MLCRTFSPQKGFSLVRLLIPLVILALLILYFLPTIGGNAFTVLNQLSYRARSVINGLLAKLSGVKDVLAEKWRVIALKIERKIEDIEDWYYRYKHKDEPRSRALVGDWRQDMQYLIELAQEEGYNMGDVILLLDRYDEGEASSRRVEAEYWDQLQSQTADIIEKNISLFRKRPLGCSDFTVELKKIWEISQRFNEETLEGYFAAKALSEDLDDPRSLEFTQDVFGWLAFDGTEWFMEQLGLAVDETGATPDYPQIISDIDARVVASSNPFDRVLADITIGEIYLNYELINPAENRFDEAIRHLSTLIAQYGNTIPPVRLVGLHMGLGLLHERVCKNNDLAVKEFKDVIACAQRIPDLSCAHYNTAHFHLGIINLQLREGPEVKPEFEKKGSTNVQTTEELLQVTPTPQPSPTPTPTPQPNPIKIIVEIPRSRSLKAMEEDEAAAATARGITKGTISVPRPIRLRPRQELGESQQMKQFKVEDLYDLDNIPNDAIREFELFLKCSSEGPRVDIARFIHNRYLGK
jgi:tetratricopeptide (TPR) repeat protein